jgi:hypothetical protein
VQEVPGKKAEFYQKISQVYTTQGNAAEARRFELFAEKAEEEIQ